MGPINANNGRSLEEHAGADAKYRIINKNDFLAGKVPVNVLNSISDFFHLPLEFHNQGDEENENKDRKRRKRLKKRPRRRRPAKWPVRTRSRKRKKRVASPRIS